MSSSNSNNTPIASAIRASEADDTATIWAGPLTLATYGSAMWWQWCAYQLSLTANLFDTLALGTDKPVVDDVSNPPSRSAEDDRPDEAPIKGYENLTVGEVVAKIQRLRDVDKVQAVLRFEAQNKRRKGVATAGRAHLSRLRDAA
jgi:hypothetical protein